MVTPAQPMILPEFQDDVTKAQQMQMLAQLLAQNKRPSEGKMISGHYIRAGGLGHLNNLAAQLGSIYGAHQSNDMMGKIRARQAAMEQGQRGDVLGMLSPKNIQNPNLPQVDDSGEAAASGLPAMTAGDPMGAERKAMGSAFPSIQKLGEELAKQRMEVFKQASAAGDPASIAASGGDPTKVKGVQTTGPVIHQTEAGPIYSMTNTRGGMQAGGVPQAAKIPVPPGANATGDILKERLKFLEKERTETAEPANRALAGAQQAYALLKSGQMQTGSEQDKLDYVKKLARFFGMDVPAGVAANEYFNTAILPAVAQTLREMRGPGTQSNQEMIQGLARSITTTKEPAALEAMLQQAMQVSLQTLAGYNGLVAKSAELAQTNPDLKLDPRLFSDLTVSSNNVPTAENEAGNPALRADPGILPPTMRPPGTEGAPKKKITVPYRSRG